MRIPIAHDFTCGWCWIALSQVRRLAREFEVEFEWRAYELFPESLGFGADGGAPSAPANADRPAVPSRMRLAYAAEGMAPPTKPRPWPMLTHRAHEAVEFAKQHGNADQLIERLYRAYWEHGLDIDSWETLRLVAADLVPDLEALRASIDARRFADRIVGFDEPAYATGVYNVPTFWIDGTRFAEQPSVVLREALIRAGARPREPEPYPDLKFPSGPPDRPYVVINMIATIDGKTETGERAEPVMDLGTALDHRTMRTIQNATEAVLIGATSLRATPKLWYPSHLKRYVVSRTGKVPFESRFFGDVPDQARLVVPVDCPAVSVPGIEVWRIGAGDVDLRALLSRMREEGVRRLLVEGGSELNAALLRRDLVDELFLTVAPKIKLGRDVPTYAGGDPLPREAVMSFHLVSEQRFGDEVYLRYRR
jgi:riboflavin biosynthesis pyrimidine reductase/predicted DsbA family dithiol-disulfide isomerase